MNAKVIAVDGPAYVGKSQIAKELSRLTGFPYINTGHMFRALAKLAMAKGLSPEQESEILNLPFEVHFKNNRTLVNQEDWTDSLDITEVVQFASQIAALPKIREQLTQIQRSYAQSSFVIMEGRDIGSSVFPDAICKIYVTASDLVRAKRLYKMMPEDEKKLYVPSEASFREILNEKLKPIDQRDFNRNVSPLISEIKARSLGYFVYDNSEIPTAEKDAENIYYQFVKPALARQVYPVTETLAELRDICQSTAKKDVSNIYMRWICRPLSIFFTRQILGFPISANQVSVVMIALGILAPCFFLFASKAAFFLGAFFLQVWYLVDCMDGEVARYRQFKATGSIVMDKRQSSLTGLYYDLINHYIVNFMVPFALGFGIFRMTGNSGWILLGGLGALAQVLMLAMHDSKSRAILGYLKKFQRVEPLSQGQEKESKTPTLLHRLFSVVHYSVTYPTVMNLTALAAILNLFTKFDWRILVFLYLCLATVLVAAVLITRILKQQLVDRELKESFTLYETPGKEDSSR